MTTPEITLHQQPVITQHRPKTRVPRQDWIEAHLADWRMRWPAVFTKPVPLAVGITGQIKAALLAEGKLVEARDRKGIGVSLHSWTAKSAYLRAMARGDARRNLDGSEAGFPDEDARDHAQKLLDERAVRHAERERLRSERLSFAALENQKEP
jgi:sRNA-binding protein